MSLRATLIALWRQVVPFVARQEIARLRHMRRYLVPRLQAERIRTPEALPYVLSRHQSPLRRAAQVADAGLQQAKEANVRETTRRLNGAYLRPGATFSYHWYVGRPTASRGYRKGLELRNEKLAKGIGGGSCQVSNLLYYLAATSGLQIVERHRHAIDLFPDDHRTVPFGCGATVYYNYADLRIVNTMPHPVAIHLFIVDGILHGEVRAAVPSAYTYRVLETDHRFFLERDQWYRSNRLWRLRCDEAGQELDRTLLSQNTARCFYLPNGDRLLGNGG